MVLIPTSFLFGSLHKGLLKGADIIKSTHKVERFDYSKIESKDDLKYWGIHPKNGRLNIDTKRYKKTSEELGIIEYLPEELFKNRSTPYFIPAYKTRYDYKINIFRDLIAGLKQDWFKEYKVVFKLIKTPAQVHQDVRLEEIGYCSCADDLDEVEETAFFAMIKRSQKYEKIIDSLYHQFLQKVCIEINRYMLIVVTDLGYKSKDFDINSFYKFSDGVLNDKSQPKIETFPKYNAFRMLNMLNNFLKHNSIEAYERLKKSYPNNVKSLKNKTANAEYKNGMYAGNWILIKENYIDEIFDKLLVFFTEYCRKILKENIEESNWNYDDYFRNAAHDLKHPISYFGY